MRFFLKVLALVSLIVIGKIEKRNAIIANGQTAQAESTSHSVYPQNSDNVLSPWPADTGQEMQHVSYHFNY
jgi:hypothetical protein